MLSRYYYRATPMHSVVCYRAVSSGVARILVEEGRGRIFGIVAYRLFVGSSRFPFSIRKKIGVFIFIFTY